jgi:hypothetical protein
MDPCSKIFCGTMFFMNVMCLLVYVLFKFKLEFKSAKHLIIYTSLKLINKIGCLLLLCLGFGVVRGLYVFRWGVCQLRLCRISIIIFLSVGTSEVLAFCSTWRTARCSS